jgi:hypothetical protein
MAAMRDFQLAQERLQRVLVAAQESIMKKYLRPLQVRTLPPASTWPTAPPPQRSFHECAADCLRKHETAPESTVQACQQNCVAPLQQGQTIVQTEMQRFQARLQREVATCEDDARITAAAQGTQESLEAAFVPCAVRAVDASIDRIDSALVPALETQLSRLLG